MDHNAPQFASRVYSGFSDRLISKLRDRILDLALAFDVRQSANFLIDDFREEQLVLVSTEPRTLNKDWTPGYIMVDWGESFMAEHTAAFPDSPPSRLIVGSEAVALNHILRHGGSGSFLESDTTDHVKSGRLVYVADAPTFRRKSYLAYRKDNAIPESIEIAISGVYKILDTT